MTSPALVAALLAALLAPAPAGAGHPDRGGAPCAADECHAGIGSAPAGGSAHGPAAEGDCDGCHDLSLSGGRPHLPAVTLGPGGDLALCGGCHAEPAAAATDAGVRTAFSEGERDLHAVHVRAAGRGPACLGCHEPHAGRQPRLLREEIPARGGMRITQRFEERPGGGRCTTRCHAAKEYRR